VSSGYQMTDAIKVPGGLLEVGTDGPDVVMHVHGSRQVRLTAKGQEEFAQLYVAACIQAKVNIEAARAEASAEALAHARASQAASG
jgi:hypothetical protein